MPVSFSQRLYWRLAGVGENQLPQLQEKDKTQRAYGRGKQSPLKDLCLGLQCCWLWVWEIGYDNGWVPEPLANWLSVCLSQVLMRRLSEKKRDKASSLRIMSVPKNSMSILQRESIIKNIQNRALVQNKIAVCTWGWIENSEGISRKDPETWGDLILT